LASGGERRINIVQGEHYVSDDPTVVLTTLLGSCVAACMRDPVAGVGGLNHFLLPGNDTATQDGPAMRHGVHAMELLVNALLRQGARRDRLEAKLFGGANLMPGLTDVGRLNADFAEGFLRREGISNKGGSLRGRKSPPGCAGLE
jgi:chemotaxis protein CheD